MNRTIIQNLQEWLTWGSDSNLLREACTIHVSWLYGRIRTWSGPIFNEVTRLPKASQQRLLLAPWTYELLQTTAEPSSDQVAQLQRFVAMEQYLAGQREQAPYTGWTAMSDTFVTPDSIRSGRAFGAIAFDVESPYATTGYGSDLTEVLAYDAADDETIDTVYAKVDEALHTVNRISERASQMIKAAVQVISAVRGVKESDTFFGSMSARRVTGRVALVNAHIPRWTSHKVADALVHEATHCLIYRLELAHPLYTSEEASQHVRVTSPWSGRSLRLHSFTHACFVWWGLRNFWSRVDIAQDPAAAAFLARAQNGFDKELLPQLLTGEVAEALQPDVIDAIVEIQRQAVRSTAAIGV